jgi:AcrR family transcriptional regulator
VVTVPPQRNVLGATVEESREQLIAAAEKCFEIYGVAKTTMDDIGRAASVTRATVYRYFADRDSLILAVVIRRSRMLLDRARAYLDSQPTFADKLVKGMVYLVDHGRRDPMVRLLVSPEHLNLATGILGNSKAVIDLTYELWSPIMATAQRNGEMREGIDLHKACAWLAFQQLILIGRLDLVDPSDPQHEEMLREFLLPAFVPAG